MKSVQFFFLKMITFRQIFFIVFTFHALGPKKKLEKRKEFYKITDIIFLLYI